MNNIREHYYARYPFVYFQTTEDDRLIRESRAAFDARPVEGEEPPQFFTWDVAAGMQAMMPVNSHGWTFQPMDSGTMKLIGMDAARTNLWKAIQSLPEGAVIWLRDFHRFMRPESPASIEVIRSALNLKDMLKRQRKTIAFLGAIQQIPPEMKDDVKPLDFEYPDETALGAILDRMVRDNELPDSENADAIVNSLRGLTSEGAENTLALCITAKGEFDVSFLLNQKAAQLKATDVEFGHFSERLEDLADLDVMIDYIMSTLHHPKARGILMYSPPGCGKSHTAKAVANAVGWPCIVLNFAAMKSKWVGESETKLRNVFKTIRAIGRCVVFMDEIEAIATGISTGGDNGLGMTMFKEILKEMEDTHGSGAYWMGTCNDLSPLIQESGGAIFRRFNATFFIDLPSEKGARAIADIWNRKEEVDIPKNFKLEGFTGANIATLAETMSMKGCSAEEARKFVLPYAEAFPKELERIRSVAHGMCIWANEKTAPEVKQSTRKVRVAR